MSRTATRSLMLRFMEQSSIEVTRYDVLDSMNRALIATGCGGPMRQPYRPRALSVHRARRTAGSTSPRHLSTPSGGSLPDLPRCRRGNIRRRGCSRANGDQTGTCPFRRTPAGRLRGMAHVVGLSLVGSAQPSLARGTRPASARLDRGRTIWPRCWDMRRHSLTTCFTGGGKCSDAR